MNSTGIVRQIDELGRIVLPKELRFMLGINEKDPLEFYLDVESKKIALKTYTSNACVFCGNIDVIHFKGKSVCNECFQMVHEGVTPA